MEYSLIGGLMTLPCLIFIGFAPLLVEVYIMLLYIFDTWYLLFNSLGFVISLSLMLQDLRIAGEILTLVGFLWSFFVDAMPNRQRIYTTIGGLAFGVCVCVIL